MIDLEQEKMRLEKFIKHEAMLAIQKEEIKDRMDRQSHIFTSQHIGLPKSVERPLRVIRAPTTETIPSIVQSKLKPPTKNPMTGYQPPQYLTTPYKSQSLSPYPAPQIPLTVTRRP